MSGSARKQCSERGLFSVRLFDLGSVMLGPRPEFWKIRKPGLNLRVNLGNGGRPDNLPTVATAGSGFANPSRGILSVLMRNRRKLGMLSTIAIRAGCPRPWKARPLRKENPLFGNVTFFAAEKSSKPGLSGEKTYSCVKTVFFTDPEEIGS